MGYSGNWDKNIQGAKLDAKRKAFEEKEKAKAEKLRARIEERKAKQAASKKQLLEGIVADLERSEEQVYTPVFRQFAGDNETVMATDPAMIQFLVEHSDISVDTNVSSLADALRESIPREKEMQVDLDTFLSLLRENSLADGAAISSFLVACQGAEEVSLAEAKAHTLHLAQQKSGCDFDKDKWDILLQSVWEDGTPMVGLQAYLSHGKKLARCARLLHYLETELAPPEEEGDEEDKPAARPKQKSKPFSHWKQVSKDLAAALGSFSSAPRALQAPRNEDDDLQRALKASMESTAGREAEESVPTKEDRKGAATSSTQSAPAASDLPPVARKCALCLACKGVCAYHVGALKTKPAAQSGGGSSASGSGLNPGSSSTPAGVPRCDLCKAQGGLCTYHARSKARSAPSGAAGSSSASGGGQASTAASSSREPSRAAESSSTSSSSRPPAVDSRPPTVEPAPAPGQAEATLLRETEPVKEEVSKVEAALLEVRKAAEARDAQLLEEAIVAAAQAAMLRKTPDPTHGGEALETEVETELLDAFHFLESLWALPGIQSKVHSTWLLPAKQEHVLMVS